MSEIEALQKQLESLADLQSIVRTMKALSAASIRQYERAEESLVDYYRTVELGLQAVLRRFPGPFPNPPGSSAPAGAVIFGSDHGLCGRFNEEIVAHAQHQLANLAGADGPSPIVAVGMRAADELAAVAGYGVEVNYLTPSSSEAITATVRQLLVKLDEWQNERGIEQAFVFHNRPADGSGYQSTGFQLLPVEEPRFRDLQIKSWPTRTLPTFRAPAWQLLSSLLHQYFFVALFQACAQSLAAEHSSRLAAMQRAEKNIDERLEELTASYRRERQGAITAELLDVVAGFEALTKKGS